MRYLWTRVKRWLYRVLGIVSPSSAFHTGPLTTPKAFLGNETRCKLACCDQTAAWRLADPEHLYAAQTGGERSC